MKRCKGPVLFLLVCIAAVPRAAAGGEPANELSKRLKQLEEEVKAISSSWIKDIKFNGDVRYRYEMIDIEGPQVHHRNRIRARLGVSAKINDHADIGVQIASGSADPVSTNQTLTEGFSSKELRLDLAYIDLHPTPVPKLHVIGGKIKNPFLAPGKTELIWDHDLNPEGGAATYVVEAGPTELFLNAGGFWVHERESDADSALFGGQGGIKANVEKESRAYLLGGASFFQYTNTAGYPTFYRAGEPLGNSTSPGNRYLYDYALFEAFAEASVEIEKIPVSIFGDLVINTATGTSEKTGWLLGGAVGKVKDAGSWAVRYNYRKLERDAVIGRFADSDFRGGGTNGQGHEVGVDYMLIKNVWLAVTYFANERNLEKRSSDFEQDYHRVQIDINAKF